MLSHVNVKNAMCLPLLSYHSGLCDATLDKVTQVGEHQIQGGERRALRLLRARLASHPRRLGCLSREPQGRVAARCRTEIGAFGRYAAAAHLDIDAAYRTAKHRRRRLPRRA